MSKAVLALSSALSLFALASCADAIVDDGSHIKAYTGGQGGVSGGAAPFSMYNDVFDFQVWGDYNAACSTAIVDGALVITQTGDWYGIAICSDAGGNDSSASASIFDLSEIAKITFEAKANTAGSKLQFSACTEDGVVYELTEEFATYEYDMSKAAHAKTGNHYCIVSLVQNDVKGEGPVHYIKNIAFFDASGNEIIPKINK